MAHFLKYCIQIETNLAFWVLGTYTMLQQVVLNFIRILFCKLLAHFLKNLHIVRESENWGYSRNMERWGARIMERWSRPGPWAQAQGPGPGPTAEAPWQGPGPRPGARGAKNLAGLPFWAMQRYSIHSKFMQIPYNPGIQICPSS